MSESAYLALLLVGFLGSPHCIGMCGGIVGALSAGEGARLPLHLAYNLGRIISYGLAGIVAGALGEASLILAGPAPLRILLMVLANLMLVALGVYLMGMTQILSFTERFGQRLWRHLQPLTQRYLPARTVAQAFPLGMLWGWLPCGMVYSALVTAMSSGSALQGAGMMLAFGLGTLPTLLLTGLLAIRLKAFIGKRVVRTVAGLIVLAFGCRGLFAAVRMMAS